MVAGLVLLDDVAGIWGWPGELLGCVYLCVCVDRGGGQWKKRDEAKQVWVKQQVRGS